MSEELKPESMWDGQIDRRNTAVDYVDRLEKICTIYKTRILHLEAMNSRMLQVLGNIFQAVRPEGIQAPDGRVLEYDPIDPEMARLYWKVMSNALKDGAEFYRTQGIAGSGRIKPT